MKIPESFYKTVAKHDSPVSNDKLPKVLYKRYEPNFHNKTIENLMHRLA